MGADLGVPVQTLPLAVTQPLRLGSEQPRGYPQGVQWHPGVPPSPVLPSSGNLSPAQAADLPALLEGEPQVGSGQAQVT